MLIIKILMFYKICIIDFVYFKFAAQNTILSIIQHYAIKAKTNLKQLNNTCFRIVKKFILKFI